jgi:hypothetical protein
MGNQLNFEWKTFAAERALVSRVACGVEIMKL